MAQLPELVSKAWDDREGPVVLTTVSADGVVNSIYATCVSKFDEERLVVADNYFDKTRQNIQSGNKGALLFITKEGKAFQVKGRISYETSGDVFDAMKDGWLDKKHPGHAAAVVHVEDVYSGAEKLA